MDVFTPKQRSEVMSRIRQKNTKPELVVRRLLHGMGYRFRLHRRDLPGTPDLVLPKYRVAILVNGCFFHRHHGCRYAYTPKTRTEFWMSKFASNIDRDRRVNTSLRSIGWLPVSLWECETERPTKLAGRLKRILKRRAWLE